MNVEHPSEPPEEPYQRSELALLSPASPKPLPFPSPANIPVLDMQMDVAFNQTEPHMADPAMHNTEVRPDFWRDPNEQQEAADQASTGAGEAADSTKETRAPGQESVEAGHGSDSADTTTNGVTHPEPVQASNEVSHQVNSQFSAPSTQEPAINSEAPPPVPSAHAPAALATDDAAQAQSSQAASEQAQPGVSAPVFPSAVDVQALLDTLAAPVAAAASAFDATHVESSKAQPAPPSLEGTPLSASGLNAPSHSLPARPPPQEQPLINPNYVHSQHIRDYHSPATHPTLQTPQHGRSNSQGNVADATAQNYVPPVQSPSNPTASASNLSSFFSQSNPSSAVSAQPAASAQAFSTNATPPVSRRESKLAAGEIPTAEDRPWDIAVQAKYDRFIDAERGYVSEGRWDQFPQGSRLFVGMRNADGTRAKTGDVVMLTEDTGNLSSEKVTKRDIFHVFHPYGDLAQISIKQAYGFVQFLNTEDCTRALKGEQGTLIKDKRIHLEISKPQKNRNQNQNQSRRSRSPDHNRGKQSAGVDRYVSGGGRGYGGRGGNFRSPSPARGGYRDRYDDRGYRGRSPDYGRGGRGYGRSPSPRRSEDDDLPLPKRNPHEIPDVQIVVLDSLDRDFIGWVEKAFLNKGVRVDVLLLSPRLNEQAVVRRQIMEGVLAVVKLTRMNQNTGRIGLQVFDRTGGAGNVRFDEYQDLDPGVCAELVLRAKAAASVPPTPASYGGAYGGQYGAPPSAQQYGSYPQPYNQQPGYAPPAQYGQQQPQAGAPPNLQNLITSLDPNSLQNLLSAMNQGQPSATPQTAGYGATPQSAGYPQNPAFASAIQQQAGQGAGAQGPGQVNMQDILAKLGSYNK